MIQAQANTVFEASVEGGATGLTGVIGVRITDTPAGTTVLARTTAGITESPAGSGLYAVALTAPSSPGVYSVVWDTGAVTPTYAREDLQVTAGAPPGAADLTTLATVREFLQMPPGETDQDLVIEDAITHASAVIQEHCEREFAPAVSSITRTFEYGGQLLDLAPFDLRSIAPLVRVDPESASPTTLTGDDYRVFPFPAKYGVFTGLRLWSVNGPARLVEVTGDWGFPSVPVVVEQACIVTVVIWLRREVQAFDRTLDIDTNRLERPSELPSAAVGMLRPFKRSYA